MNVIECLKNKILFFDGGTGSVLQSRGLMPGELPELWNLEKPEEIIRLHREYLEAGCDIIKTNTFGINSLKFGRRPSVNEVVQAGMKCAKEALKGFENKFIALDIGPCGKLLKPLGDLEFENAVSLFAEVINAGKAYADLVLIETMNDSLETKAAVLAAKENCDLPVFVTNVYDSSSKLMTGASPEAMAAMLEGLGADAIGVNCSLGPIQLMPTVKRLLACCSVPVIVNPNAGLPRAENGKTVYDISPEEFALATAEMAKLGARVTGGCCGTTPEHIKLLRAECEKITPVDITDKNITLVSSYTQAVQLGENPVIIGERINPTGKKAFKEALRNGDIAYILGEGIAQQEAGAQVLDVNVGLPEIDEADMMVKVINELQAVCELPLQIDTSNPVAMEKALRIYNGKAMINSVNGKRESMEAVFPLAAKYGGVIVALTLDENGIPMNAEGRFEIAEKICREAKKYGIGKKDLVIDPLALTISSERESAKVTLEAIKMLHEAGYKTSLGVSNISFGLPCREQINSAFFAMALNSGLSAAIMNPKSSDMMKTYYSYRALAGLDEACMDYIGFASNLGTQQSVAAPQRELSLKDAIVKGLKTLSAECAAKALEKGAPLDIVNNEIIPALDAVGKDFEAGTVFLPQLLMSAEAAKSAFDVIKSTMGRSGASKCIFVIATVKGDIHDIGKNIVKVLLENYGFNVIDLGKDVPPEEICRVAAEKKAPLVGLSALMTTTVPAMEETIKLLKKTVPECKVIVGGAVLTQEYADMIGADKYAKDAMEAVRYADEINGVVL